MTIEVWISLLILSLGLNLYLISRSKSVEKTTSFHIKGYEEVERYAKMFRRLSDTSHDVVIKIQNDRIEFYSLERKQDE